MRLYKESDLQDALFEALDLNENAEAYVEKFVTNVGKILKKRPQTYRYFGPYWWPLKQLMIEHGVQGIDDFIDLEWLQKTALKTPELNCVAAWSFQESLISGMELPVNQVSLEGDDGDIVDYTLADDFMESLVAVG